MVSELVKECALFACEKAVTEYRQRKEDEARNLIIKYISAGDLSHICEDELIALFERLKLAFIVGNAHRNLELLTKLLSALLKNETLKPGLYASTFSRYASIIETLSYEEIQILATTSKFELEKYKSSILSRDEQARKYLIENSKAMSKDEYDYTMMGLTRTGLVTFEITIDNIKGANNPHYKTTNLFDKIIELIDFQDAIDKETNSANI